MSCCGSSYGTCENRLVAPRCTDIAIFPILIGDQNGNVLVDNFDTAFSLGIDRVGTTMEFEFNRQYLAPLT